MSETEPKRIAWAITGSGHYLKECLELALAQENIDLFLSAAGAEVLAMYGYDLKSLREKIKIFRDNNASSPPVGSFYKGIYHTLVIAPATSNTVAKCVVGIADSLVTNIYAQAGKRQVESIVFACDVAPAMETEAPSGQVMVYPRKVDLEATEKLATFEYTQVATSYDQLKSMLEERVACQNTFSS